MEQIARVYKMKKIYKMGLVLFLLMIPLMDAWTVYSPNKQPSWSNCQDQQIVYGDGICSIGELCSLTKWGWGDCSGYNTPDIPSCAFCDGSYWYNGVYRTEYVLALDICAPKQIPLEVC